ncbi:transposase [Fusarium oxysporum f. sp. phaseoli]
MQLIYISIGSKMSKERESRIFSAFNDLETAPLAPTARKHAIPRSTLRGRKKGSTNARDAQIEHQKLSQEQEKFLVNWILNEEEAGRAPTKKNIQGFGQLILKHDNQAVMVGNHWVNRFISRHEDIKMKLSRPVDAVRTRETSEERLQRFYKLLGTKSKRKTSDRASYIILINMGLQKGKLSQEE